MRRSVFAHLALQLRNCFGVVDAGAGAAAGRSHTDDSCVRSIGTIPASLVFLFFFLFTISACSNLSAQTFSLITGREPVTSLDGLWRFHTGDNPAWADPNFNDSNWPLVRSVESWTRQGYPAFNGYAWYRFKVEVQGDGRPVDLLLTQILDGYKVFADGKLIGNAGSSEATTDPVFSGRRSIFPLPTGTRGPHSIQIALRVWTYQPIVFWSGAGTRGTGNEAGDPVLLSHHLRSDEASHALDFVNEYAYGLFAGLIGLAVLALFLLRPSDKEYLSFAVLLLAEAATTAFHLTLNLGSIPFPLWRAVHLICVACSAISALMFFSVVLHTRRSWLWWTICIAVGVSPLTAALIYFQWTGVGVSFAIAEVCVVPAYAWVITELLVGAFRKDVSARLLLVPVVLFYGMSLLSLSARITYQLSGGQADFPTDITLIEHPFQIGLGDIVLFVFILALLIFLVRRFSLARKEEERMAGEFEAAKTMQLLLIPAAPPATPGFKVENVYLPAQEVGGDFFQVLPGGDGSLLIVVGDVSGKGLKAAMTVSVIVGALRGCTLRAPAEVLAYLNSALRGQVSGFFTCCAALIDAEGKLTIANAGHLPPYLDGAELELPGALPLGVQSGIQYTAVEFRIEPGSRLTFISDGVVEAQNDKGELFGFDRSRELSMSPAASIVEAALAFGQQDDITVVALACIGVPDSALASASA